MSDWQDFTVGEKRGAIRHVEGINLLVLEQDGFFAALVSTQLSAQATQSEQTAAPTLEKAKETAAELAEDLAGTRMRYLLA
jgi:hypothetical protein